MAKGKAAVPDELTQRIDAVASQYQTMLCELNPLIVKVTELLKELKSHAEQ